MAYTIQKGGNIVFLVDDVAIECLTQADYNSSTDELDTTCKNSTNSKSFEPGAYTHEFSLSGNYTDGTGSNEDYHTLHVKYLAGTSFTGKIGGVDTGDKTYAGSCRIMSLNLSSGNSGTLVTWNATVKVSGAMTVATVA